MGVCDLKNVVLVCLGCVLMQKVSASSSSCELSLHGCGYEVTVKPKSRSCVRENPFQVLSRQKRSEAMEHQTPLSREDFEELSKRMSKTLEKLSTRVLRWWRKLDKKVNQLATRGGGGSRSQDMSINHRCPDGFIGIENWPACYLMSHFNTSWYDAKDYCSAFESDLVAMGTVREHFLLTFLIKNNPVISEAAGWWTSGSFLGNTRQWMWTSQFFTKPFTFIKWAEGEPNEEGSQCMLLRKDHNHQWNDDICTERYNFICEIQTVL